MPVTKQHAEDRDPTQDYKDVNYILTVLRDCVNALDNAFDSEGDTFGRNHDDAVEAINRGEATLKFHKIDHGSLMT